MVKDHMSCLVKSNATSTDHLHYWNVISISWKLTQTSGAGIERVMGRESPDSTTTMERKEGRFWLGECSSEQSLCSSAPCLLCCFRQLSLLLGCVRKTMYIYAENIHAVWIYRCENTLLRLLQTNATNPSAPSPPLPKHPLLRLESRIFCGKIYLKVPALFIPCRCLTIECLCFVCSTSFSLQELSRCRFSRQI